LLALSALSACPSPLEPPVALISAGSSTEIGEEADCDGAAAPTLTTQVGIAARLHGACSHDPNGLPLRHHWAIVDQPNGSAIALPNADVISPTVIPDLEGRYRLSLIVSNGKLTSEPAFVTVLAN
jgi:hypothetical protein